MKNGLQDVFMLQYAFCQKLLKHWSISLVENIANIDQTINLTNFLNNFILVHHRNNWKGSKNGLLDDEARTFSKHENEVIKFIGINKTLYLSKAVKLKVRYLARSNYLGGKKELKSEKVFSLHFIY